MVMHTDMDMDIYNYGYVCNHGPLGSWMILGSRVVRHPHFLVESFGEVSGLLPSSDTVAHAVSVVCFHFFLAMSEARHHHHFHCKVGQPAIVLEANNPTDADMLVAGSMRALNNRSQFFGT